MTLKSKKAVTLAEVLVVLVIISLLTAMSVLIPKPKALEDTNLVASAFNSLRQLTGEVHAIDADGILDSSYCSSVISKINTVNSNCSGTTMTYSSFATTNGMIFYGMGNTFATNPIEVAIDINGDNLPGTSAGGYLSSNENKDLYRFYIYTNGRVEPVSTGARSKIKCKLVMDSYNPTYESDVKTVVMNVKGYTDAQATTFMTNLPGVLSNVMTYEEADSNVFSSSKLNVFGTTPKAAIAVKYYKK